MNISISIFRVIHILSAVLMIWPFYALVAVNQRIRLGPPLGDRADTYMENIIINRTIPCFVFQATVAISGLVLIWLRGQGLDALIRNPALGLKFLLLLIIAGMLSYVHFYLQPRINAQFALNSESITPEIATLIGTMRAKRKRFASVCLFLVLTTMMLGMQVWVPFPLWLTILLVGLIAAFTWRANTSEMSYGWF
jgi:hypothetical protein